VRLAAYDVRGRLVRALLQRSVQDPGEHLCLRDGRNASGIRLPRGVYLVRLTASSTQASRKLFLARIP
jgi:hypothetical protein